MPRQARLDSPGLLHHVMARGLNRQAIFTDDTDRREFLGRTEAALKRSPNEILAWALMPNHIHFLIRSGADGIAGFFRRLMTGYAVSFNQRHKRTGYLFQGRFKSLVCDEDDYFLALVRYIHLNPVSAGLVRSIEALSAYPFTGHSALMGKTERPWQSIDDVLGRFGRQAGVARKHYVTYLGEGLPEVRRQSTDLLGAGLMEPLLKASRSARRESDRAYYDPRILGESDFVTKVLTQADQDDSVRQRVKRQGATVRAIATCLAKVHNVEEYRLFERGRQADVSAAKADLIYAGVQFLGKTVKEMAGLTKMSTQAASQARLRGSENRVKIQKCVS